MNKEMTAEDKEALDLSKKQGMARLVSTDAFVLVSIDGEDVNLTRGCRDGYQTLAMVGALGLAVATMNAETLSAGMRRN